VAAAGCTGVEPVSANCALLGDDDSGLALMIETPSVVYVAPDKMGGVMAAISSVISHGPQDGFPSQIVLTRNRADQDPRFTGTLPAPSTTVEYALPGENLHAVMRRVAAAVPPGRGVYVASDLLDLATASVHDFGRAIVHVLHGDSDYYIDLAVKHDPVVHAYVAISRRIRERLVERLPHRAGSIFYLPHGIALPRRVREASNGPLSLVFAGRLDDSQKGVLDLPAIDEALRARGVARRWTIIGGGPDQGRLREAWAGVEAVEFTGVLTHDQTVDRLADHDVFVLPTRNEGLPIALLEAIAAGVVPVVSAVSSGVSDVVEPGVSGVLPPAGDVAAFADAIAALDQNRPLLGSMRASGRRIVETRYEARACAAAYQALYARHADLYRPLSADARLQYGSRLDQPWLPNTLVRLVRTAVRSAR
jgi:glycosyltransferase involved in cell wall biosynthesis